MGEDRNERRYIAEERAAVLVDDEEVIFIIAGDNRKGCVVGAV